MVKEDIKREEFPESRLGSKGTFEGFSSVGRVVEVRNVF